MSQVLLSLTCDMYKLWPPQKLLRTYAYINIFCWMNDTPGLTKPGKWLRAIRSEDKVKESGLCINSSKILESRIPQLIDCGWVMWKPEVSARINKVCLLSRLTRLLWTDQQASVWSLLIEWGKGTSVLKRLSVIHNLNNSEATGPLFFPD